MITLATLFWAANSKSYHFSSMYNEVWVEKLYRGIERNYPASFRFIVWTDRIRRYVEPIEQRLLNNASRPTYGDCLQPYEYSAHAPMILMGLDTVITGDLTGLVNYASSGDVIALPRDPYDARRVCNGVALIPRGNSHVWKHWDRQTDDMTWMRKNEHSVIDDRFPGQVVSYKGHVKANGLGDARIVFFHGNEKPHELPSVAWIKEHWR